MGSRRVWRWTVLAVVSMLTVVVLPPAPARAGSGEFIVFCGFSHRAPDDPIVSPGRPGAAHMHDFAGATTTDAFSTPRSLRRSPTTCDRRADHSAYWVPTLYRNGRPVRASALPGIRVYYRARGKDPRSLRPLPRRLRMIAGDAHLHHETGRVQDTHVASWSCSAQPFATRTIGPAPPAQRDCAGAGDALRLRIQFPDCWDGRRMDSPDHRSHMAYSRRGRCPTTHPVPVPEITFTARYRIADWTELSLASGSVYTAHADFFNGWRQRAQRRLIRRCLIAERTCIKS